MARLRSQTMYVLLFLMLIHIGAFAATRILITEQKTHIEAVWHLLPDQEQLRNLVHVQLVHCMTCRVVIHMYESTMIFTTCQIDRLYRDAQERLLGKTRLVPHVPSSS